MSEDIKKKAGSWATIIYRTFIGIAMLIILKSIPIFIYDAAKWQKDIDDRTLSSVEMRIDLERHMAIWTIENQAKAFGRLGANEKAVIALRKADSLMKIEIVKMKGILAQIERNTRK